MTLAPSTEKQRFMQTTHVVTQFVQSTYKLEIMQALEMMQHTKVSCHFRGTNQARSEQKSKQIPKFFHSKEHLFSEI